MLVGGPCGNAKRKAWEHSELSMAKTLSVLLWLCIACFPAHADTGAIFPFAGEFDPQKKSLTVAIHPEANSPLVMNFYRADDLIYHISVNIKDWQTAFFNLSSVIEGTVDVKREEGGTFQSLVGKIESRYTLVNHKPVEEMFGQFEIKEGKLMIHSLSLGRVAVKGTVLLRPPYPVDLRFQLAGVPLEDFIAFFSGRPKFMTQGLVDGDIFISGPSSNLQMKGTLFSSNGVIKSLEYSSIVLNAQGIYPVIVVDNSTIVQADGAPFNIAGNIDLSDKENFSRQIEALAKTPLVNYERDHLEWTLKRIQSENEAGTTELKYLMRKGEDRDHVGDSGVDMLGVERKMEF